MKSNVREKTALSENVREKTTLTDNFTNYAEAERNFQQHFDFDPEDIEIQIDGLGQVFCIQGNITYMIDIIPI